jgi:hypothetical protein
MSKVKGKTEAIVAGVIAGLDRAEIARQAGISGRTLRRRLAEPEVIEAIADARLQLHGQIVSQLQQLAFTAIEEVTNLLHLGEERVKATAAKLVLDQLVTQKNAFDDGRITALEVAVARSLDQTEEQA